MADEISKLVLNITMKFTANTVANILNVFPNVHQLQCHKHILDLAGIGNCMTLHTLDLANCEHVWNLNELARCINLTNLDLSGCKLVTCLAPLGNCIKLCKLTLMACQITDVR